MNGRLIVATSLASGFAASFLIGPALSRSEATAPPAEVHGELAYVELFQDWATEVDDFATLVDNADFAVVGRVTRTQVLKSQNGPPITRATVAVESVIGNRLEQDVTEFVVEQLGGVQNGVVSENSENPLLRTGTREVLFLVLDGTVGGVPRFTPVSGFQGRFSIHDGRVHPNDEDVFYDFDSLPLGDFLKEASIEWSSAPG